MALDSGERQVATDLKNIRGDHLARYEFVASREKRTKIVDAGCGIGYGSKIMFDAGNTVFGLDIDQETLDFAETTFQGPTYIQSDLSKEVDIREFDVAVCFEVLEHLKDPRPLLKSLRTCSRLYASVPNEEVVPYTDSIKFHHRHYTAQQFRKLLNDSGWDVELEFSQPDAHSKQVLPGVRGRTLVFVCKKAVKPIKPVKVPQLRKIPDPVPERVAIIGLGPSSEEFNKVCKRLGGTQELVDEVWGINGIGDVIRCDRIFHMDDVRIQEIRAEAQPKSNIANMLKWMRKHPGPIYTSRVHKGYPGLVGMPIEDMIRKLKFAYFNSTAAWAIAYAIYIGVKQIALFGIDFTYKNSHDAEKGRACCEFWLGVATQHGIKVSFPPSTSLMDGCELQEDRLYGYDTVRPIIDVDDKGTTFVYFEEVEDLPSAAEIEAKYNHDTTKEC